MLVKLTRTLPIPEAFIVQMKHTEQNPRFHAEGNVYNHTLFVLEQYHKHIDAFDLSEEEKDTLYWAAVLHDVGKPRVTRWLNGRWVARGHEAAGVPIARDILLQKNFPKHKRRQILDIVRWHHVPMRWGLMGTRYNAYRTLMTQTDIRLLGIFSLFDVLGRICVNKSHVLEVVDYFNEQVVPRIEHEFGTFQEVQGLFQAANRKKKNALWHALKADDLRLLERILYQPTEAEQRPRASCVITLGPPKAGKTQYLQAHFPDHEYLYLDATSQGLQPKGSLLDLERQFRALRKHLCDPHARERRLVIDGMHLNIGMRKKLTDYIRDCGAEIHYLFFTKSLEELYANNEQADSPLTKAQIQAFNNQHFFPHPWEAHQIDVID